MISLLNKFDDNYMIKEEDVAGIIKSYIQENGLETYYCGVIFDDNSKDLGKYNIKNNTIILNDKRIIKFCYKIADKLTTLYHVDEKYYTYFFNFSYLYILYHELMHVMQKARYEKNVDNKDDVYVYLYELCMRLHHSNLVFYRQNHDIFPMEIEANNLGFLKSYQLLSYTKLPTRESRIMYLQYLSSSLLYYRKVDNRIITPLDKLVLENDSIDVEKMFWLLANTKLSRNERLNLGLDITTKEYDSLINEKNKILAKYK